MTRRRVALVCLCIGAAVLAVSAPYVGRIVRGLKRRAFGGKTVEERLAQYGPAARERLAPHFRRAGVAYPPATVTLLGIKDRKRLDVYAASPGQPIRFILAYPIVAASGGPGPKLREGDRQVPEGIYRIESLNPNSRFHLSLRIDYPNAFDRAMAERDGRRRLGGDIMIHGSSGSVGCLAMGDEVSEDLFVLAADTGIEAVTVVLTPTEFRGETEPTGLPTGPAWVGELYDRLRHAVAQLPQPTQ